jgi:preprotein translocase subunit YajC
MIILYSLGGIILILSFLAPPLLTVSEWMDQLNLPDDPSQPEPDLFVDFEPGDTVYLEGQIGQVWYFSEQELYIVEVGDSESSCFFVTAVNITKYDTNEDLFFQIEIRKSGNLEGSSEILGYFPLDHSEEAVLVDVQKEYFSYKLVYLICGLFLILMGILLTFFWVRSKRRITKSEENPPKHP